MTWQRAERLCLNAKKLKVSYNELVLDPITLSLGVAAFPEHGSTYMSLLSAVDAAMYRAKNEGRDRVVVAGDGKPAN